MHISSFDQFGEVASNLHDCPFDLSRAVFDKATGTWKGFFLRPLWDDPRAEHRRFYFLYARSRLPVAEATLTVSAMSNYIVADGAQIGRYSFNAIKPTRHGIRLLFNEDLDIDLELSGIEACYEERPLAHVYAIYQQFLLLQTGPYIETAAA